MPDDAYVGAPVYACDDARDVCDSPDACENTLSAVKMLALSERALCRPSECLMRWEKTFWRAEMLNLRKLSQKSHPKGTSYPKKHYLCAHIFVSTS